MICTGLKKWRPTNLSGRPEASAMAVTASELVLDAKIAEGFIMGPSACMDVMEVRWIQCVLCECTTNTVDQ